MLGWLRVRSTVAVALAAVAFAGVAFVGCGGTEIDSKKAEDTLQHELEGSVPGKISSVDCPSGIEVEAGRTFSCEIALEGGKKETVKLKIVNKDADLAIVHLGPDK